MLEEIHAARARLAGQINTTPCVHSRTLSESVGAEVFLKLENLQFTASFKERGALNRLLTLNADERARGVIAMSAGNHAQALAYHGQRLGIPVTIVMPRITPNAKVEQTRVFGAEVSLHGNEFDETLTYTTRRAAAEELVIVHPYDDPQVIAGQGTLGLEILDQVPDAEAIVVPVGGGGLISGLAQAVKATSPQTRIYGAQVRRYAAAYQAFHGRDDASDAVGHATVAEGIAVKSPGRLTLPMIRALVDDMVTVPEHAVEQSVFDLLELEKIVVEGAGAVGLAALREHAELCRGKRVVLVVTGGNIDMMILSAVLQRALVRSGRLVRLAVEIRDVPGALGELTRALGELDSNIIELDHQRAFRASSVRATVVELVLQLRGEERVENLIDNLAKRGFEAERRD